MAVGMVLVFHVLIIFIVFFCQGPVRVGGQHLPLAIAGDAAYPLQTWLMKAYPASQENDPAKQLFNQRLGAARVVVEHAFGRLKCRWRRILKRSENSYKHVPKMAFVAAILHNIVEVNEVPMPQRTADVSDELPQPPTAVGRTVDDNARAKAIRERLREAVVAQNWCVEFVVSQPCDDCSLNVNISRLAWFIDHGVRPCPPCVAYISQESGFWSALRYPSCVKRLVIADYDAASWRICPFRSSYKW